MEHDCNAYCTDTEHCDLVYTEPITPEEMEPFVWWAYYYEYGLSVTRVLPAREAPPLASVPPDHLENLTGRAPADGDGWLVWYEREDQEDEDE